MKEVSINMNENQDINVNTEVQGEQAPIDKQEMHEEKMLPQSKVNEIVESRLKRERERLEKQFNERLNALEEAQKLAQMSDDERKEHDYAKRLSDLEAREKALQEKESAYNKTQYLNEIENQLKSKGLPTDMAELLVSLPAEEVSAKIASMEKSFNTQVNNSIQDKIKSSANTPTVPQEQNRLLTLDEIKALSTNEYLANRELVEKSLKALRK